MRALHVALKEEGALTLVVSFCQTFSKNGSNFTKEAAPTEEPESEPFWMEPEPFQTDLNCSDGSWL
jgi:hypothetical protein